MGFPMRRSTAAQANAVGWLLVLPAALLLATFTHYPTIATLWSSFFSTPKKNRPAVWIGLDNYQAMMADPVFWTSLKNNLWFALGTIPTSIALALAMALLVNANLRGRGFLRMSYFTPTMLPMIAVANIWLFFYTPRSASWTGSEPPRPGRDHSWLGDPGTVLGCLMVLAIWKDAGFFMIFYLAALQGISPELDEAALIEGRRALVLLPPGDAAAADADHALRPGQRDDQLLQARRPHLHPDQGRAGQRLLAPALLHLRSRLRFWDTAYASTLTVVLLLILGALAVAQFNYIEKRVHYQ